VHIETLRGPVDVEDIGTTLMHEHVFVLFQDLMLDNPQGWDEEDAVERAVERLTAVKDRGVDTIVDLTVLGLGRCVPRLKIVADRVDINIVAATGYYTWDGLPLYFYGAQAENGRSRPTIEPTLGTGDPMVDLFVRDITEGIGRTGVKAAILKCATEVFGMTPGVERVVRAVGRAHRATGVPITTHTNVHTRSGLLQQQVLRDEGVDLTRVVIGHSGDSQDLGYLEELLDAGSYLGMDRFGLDYAASTKDRIWTVTELCKRGYADRMVLSHDACCVIGGHPHQQSSSQNERTPNSHWTYLFDEVIPALMDNGVDEHQIRQMLVENPKHVFSQQGSY
jgi:phosphotriesterase-related protein